MKIASCLAVLLMAIVSVSGQYNDYANDYSNDLESVDGYENIIRDVRQKVFNIRWKCKCFPTQYVNNCINLF